MKVMSIYHGTYEKKEEHKKRRKEAQKNKVTSDRKKLK